MLRACRMRLPGMSGLMCRVTAPQLPFITELPEVPRAEVRTRLAWSEPAVVTSTMRCGWAGAAPSPSSDLESAIVALQATLDMMARWGQSAQARFRHPRLLAELEALLAERQSGPLPPPARRQAISVNRASTQMAVAGAGRCLDNFEAQIAERWADWRRGELPADEARLSCETCASTSGPAAAPAARARGTRHTMRRRRCGCPQIACPNQEGARRKTPGALRRAPRSAHARLRKLGQSHGGAGGVPPPLPSALPRGCGGSRASAAVVRWRLRAVRACGAALGRQATAVLAATFPSAPPAAIAAALAGASGDLARATDTLQKVRGTRVAVGIARTRPAARTEPDVGRGGVARCRCRCATGRRSSSAVLARRAR